MQLGILSDTHGYFHPDLVDVLDGVDAIVHAGDVGDLAILDGLEALAPVHAVYGNIDDADTRRRLPEQKRVSFGGLSVWVAHIAGRPGRWQANMGERLAADPPDVFICGHSHILRIERVAELDNMLFVNPGAAGRQGFHQKKTCLRLTVTDGKATNVDVIHLDESPRAATPSPETGA